MRWLIGDTDSNQVRKLASEAGGHATLLKGGDLNDEVFHPLDNGLAKLHRNLKEAFDPYFIFNPDRMFGYQ